jgi:hypothetical protein
MLSKETITKINNIISDLESFCLKVDDGLIKKQELNGKFHDTKNDISSNIIEKESDEWRMFDNWCQGYLWKNSDNPGYATPAEKEKLESLIDILKKILNKNTPHSEKNEKSFSPSEEYQAKRYILKILQGAQKKIIIIDNYLDENIFDFIDSIDDKVEIYLITDSLKPIFNNLYKSIIKNRSLIRAKINNISHDRYIIIDDSVFYHMGASINTIGKKDFMINKIESETEQNEKLNNFNSWWKNGKDIK